jgi:transcriptional regulator with XRE-family HTH domain
MDKPLDELYKEIGSRARIQRETLHLTQAQVAEKIDVADSFYGQIERGVTVPSINTLIGIAEALNIEVSDLFPDKVANNDPYLTSIATKFKDLEDTDKQLISAMVDKLYSWVKEKKSHGKKDEK